MSSETFDLLGLAKYLKRDARVLEKLASRGRLPGRRVGGDWRFNRDEVNQWLEREMAGLSDRQLQEVEVGVGNDVSQAQELDLLVSELMSRETMAVPLQARTAPAILPKLVEAANGTWQVYDPQKILAVVKAREDLYTTSLPGGVAVPHPRRPQPDLLGDSLIGFGRTTTGIPFGAPLGGLTDLFFLVLCQDTRTHLQVLARLARMFQRPEFLEELRGASDAAQTLEIIRNCEEKVLA